MKRRWLLLPLSLPLACGVAWSAGFSWFELEARRAPVDPGQADGIVALTGGAERIETALQLLAEGRAPALLISGVGRGSEFADFVHPKALGAEATRGQITLGRDAVSTLGNAAETAAWAQAHGMRRIIVVTAGYHMPRALLEIGRRMPGLTLQPEPVQPLAMRRHGGRAILHLLAGEYDKLLAARLGIAALLRGDER